MSEGANLVVSQVIEGSDAVPVGQIDIAWMQQLAYVNVSGDSPTLGGSTNRPSLRRDPTPLFDLLPPNWRK